jgi:arylformamidase
MSLYRAMDRRTLDAAYNNSAAVVDSEGYIADWQERSAALRARMPAHLDLAYADKSTTRLDFFSCGRPAAPTLLFFHGGYWQRNTKEGFAFVAEGPLAHGFHVAVAGYTLAPQAKLDTIVSEARSALRWLQGEIAGLGGDPDGLFVSGWSAGGHLTAMMMSEPAARGGIAISGLYDLEPIRLSYLNEKLRLDGEEARRNSPLFHLPAQAGKLIVAVGALELPELRRQSADFAAAWREHGLACELRELPGCHHYAALEELASPEGTLAQALEKIAAPVG